MKFVSSRDVIKMIFSLLSHTIFANGHEEFMYEIETENGNKIKS